MGVYSKRYAKKGILTYHVEIMFDAPTLVEKATRVATVAHSGQVRKSDGSPYIVHPVMCAMMLLQYHCKDEVVAAALVHDVLEDTDFGEEKLRDVLGDKVVDIVMHVSEDKNKEWEARKEEYVEMVRIASTEVKLVSVADKVHNMQSVLFTHQKEGEKIWSVFTKGKEKKLWYEELCLAMFKDTLKHPLVDEYEKLVAKMRTLM